jgi:hypothetical protein
VLLVLLLRRRVGLLRFGADEPRTDRALRTGEGNRLGAIPLELAGGEVGGRLDPAREEGRLFVL